MIGVVACNPWAARVVASRKLALEGTEYDRIEVWVPTLDLTAVGDKYTTHVVLRLL